MNADGSREDFGGRERLVVTGPMLKMMMRMVGNKGMMMVTMIESVNYSAFRTTFMRRTHPLPSWRSLVRAMPLVISAVDAASCTLRHSTMGSLFVQRPDQLDSSLI